VARTTVRVLEVNASVVISRDSRHQSHSIRRLVEILVDLDRLSSKSADFLVDATSGQHFKVLQLATSAKTKFLCGFAVV